MCPEQWSEGLQDVTVVDGIGLLPHPVEAHVGQAGTLGLLVALAEGGVSPVMLGIDEDTSVVLEPGAAWSRCGSGAVWEVRAGTGDGSVTVRRHVRAVGDFARGPADRADRLAPTGTDLLGSDG